jgi:hypothetical protein
MLKYLCLLCSALIVTSFTMVSAQEPEQKNVDVDINIYNGDSIGQGDSGVIDTSVESADPGDDEVGGGGESNTIGGIEPADVNEMQLRRKAINFETVGFGPASLQNLGVDELSYNFYAGRLWEVNQNAAIKAIGEVTTDFDKAVFASIGLGANLYPFNADISPYIGGDLGLGIGRGFGDNAFGFDLGVALGALLFRTSNVQMSLEGKVHTLLNEIDGDFPYYLTGRIGILF